MINVYKALLAEAKTGKLSYSDMFKCGAGVQTNTTKTNGYSHASLHESKKLVFGDFQAIKNSTSLPISFTFATGTKVYSTKLEAVTDMEANLATYYPNI